jgi:hypothetical protein
MEIIYLFYSTILKSMVICFFSAFFWGRVGGAVCGVLLHDHLCTLEKIYLYSGMSFYSAVLQNRQVNAVWCHLLLS